MYIVSYFMQFIENKESRILYKLAYNYSDFSFLYLYICILF